MNIGIDVDGTLIDIARFMLKKGEEYFHKPADNPVAFHLEQMFSLTNWQLNRFWIRHFLSYCLYSPIINGAEETIRRLQEEGNRIIIITSRAYTTGRWPLGSLPRTILKKWLKKRGVPYDAIAFCSDSAEAKAEECTKQQVDVMIDDIPDNLITISRDRAVIAYPMPWNRDITNEEIPRARDWADIYDIISQYAETAPQPS